MAFTDRYIKLPVKVFNRKEKELTDNERTVDTWLKVNPFEIESYRPSFDEDGSEEGVDILTKSGDSFSTDLSVNQFETVLNTFASK